MNQNTWNSIMKLKSKDKRHTGVANTLDSNDRETILATADFFGAEQNDLFQINFDLGVARYRVFDWLGMAVMGRMTNRNALKVFVHSFLKVNGDVDKFIQDLRETDYDIDNSWESTEVDESEDK